jgi:hypothetical protein
MLLKQPVDSLILIFFASRTGDQTNSRSKCFIEFLPSARRKDFFNLPVTNYLPLQTAHKNGQCADRLKKKACAPQRMKSLNLNG